MERSVTPISAANSGIVIRASLCMAAKISPDVFPDGFPDVFPDGFPELERCP